MFQSHAQSQTQTPGWFGNLVMSLLAIYVLVKDTTVGVCRLLWQSRNVVAYVFFIVAGIAALAVQIYLVVKYWFLKGLILGIFFGWLFNIAMLAIYVLFPWKCD